MPATERKTISVEIHVEFPVEKVWEFWTQPEHITHWNFASDEWHCPYAENDIRPGGRFSWRMEARDRSAGFDFCGIYKQVIPHTKIAYTLDDGRKVDIDFSRHEQATRVTETFEAEDVHAEEMQRSGWQSILDNFKRYVESRT